MVEVMRRDFNEHHMMQVPMTKNYLGEIQMTEEVAEHVGMKYPDFTDSGYAAQPVDDFSFLGRKQDQPKTLSQWMKMRDSQKQ